MSASDKSDFRSRFWDELPPLPPGVALERLSSIVVPQPGPGGGAVFDLVRLKAGDRSATSVLGYRARALPVDVVALARRLRAAGEQLRLRGEASTPGLHILATESAGPSTIESCEREHLGIVDLRGTVHLRSRDLFIRVEGSRPLEREPRGSPFRGKAARIVRALLDDPGAVRTIRALSTVAQVSYVHAFEVVSGLEKAGYVYRRSPRTGVVLRDPVGLLRAWIASSESTSVATEPFYARATTPSALSEGMKRLQNLGASAVFTLAAGIPSGAELVSAIPHGIYSTASTHLVQEAFGLRRQTPHNFLLLRPEPAADSEHGGILSSVRELPHGSAVAIPQLIVDLHRLGGRHMEQAEALLASWARSLPVVETT